MFCLLEEKKKQENIKKLKNHFFLAGLSALEEHFLQLTSPFNTLKLVVLTLLLQRLHTKMLSRILAAASGNLPINNHHLFILYLFHNFLS